MSTTHAGTSGAQGQNKRHRAEIDVIPQSLARTAYNGNASETALLLESGANVNQTTPEGFSPLLLAAMEGHVNVVALILAADGVNVNQATVNGCTPLYVAAQAGHSSVVALLLATDSVEVNQATLKGCTPLLIAAEKGHAVVAELLLAVKGVQVNKTMSDGASPLLFAALNGHTTLVKLLLAAGVSVNQAKANGCTSLHIAAFKGHASVVQLLLAATAINVNQSMSDGATPLHIAVQSGHASCVKLLLAAKGVYGNKAKVNGATPLHIAAQQGHTAVTELLLGTLSVECNVHVAVAGSKGFEASYEALRVNISASAGGKTPLYLASTGGRVSIASLLVLHGACNSGDGHFSQTVFKRDVFSSHPDIPTHRLWADMCVSIMRMLDDHATFTTLILPTVRFSSTEPRPCHTLCGHEATILSLIAEFAGVLRGRKLRNARQFADFFDL